VSTLIVNTEPTKELSADFIGPPEQVSLERNVAASVTSQPELNQGDLTTQLHCADTNKIREATEARNKNSVIADLIQKFGSLSSIVRVTGVAAIVLSMCLFLLDGMGTVNDTQRFFTMLMLTGLLSAGGFALAFLLKEQRGARSFFGLALLSVPANFAVLGALFYSVFQFDSISTAYPSVAHWKLASFASLGTTALFAAVALLPVTVIGASVMGREARAWISGGLLFSSSMMLLPVRDPAFIAPIVAALVFALISLVKSRGEGMVSLKTPAGRFVQSLLFLPPAIMLSRSFWLYDVNSLSALVTALTVTVVLRYVCERIKPAGIVYQSLHVTGAIVAFITASLSVDIVSSVAGTSYEALVFSIVFGVLMFDIEHRVKHVEMARILGIGTSLVLATIILIHQQIHDGIVVFVLGFCLPIALVGVGILQKHKHKMLIGGLTLATVLLLNAGGMIQVFMQTGWYGLALLGACAILSASLLERYGAMFSIRARRWRDDG